MLAVLIATLVGCSSDDEGPGGRASTTAEETAEANGTSEPLDVDEDPDRVPNPTLSPVTGGSGQAAGALRYDVTEYGYAEEEFFFEGTATTHPPAQEPPAPYRSRMIVWTPIDPDRFNGTTVVEWAHVSDFGQFELTVELNYLAPMLEEEGYAFVLVTAEEGGVCDKGPSGCSGLSMTGADPDRYGTLDHPGDAYSFAIFSQAMQAIKHPEGTSPLGDLDTEVVIATGFQPSIDKWFPTGSPDPESSTSPFSIYGPLNAYLANGADDDARLADAFLIDAAAPAQEPEYRVPTLHHLDETAIRRDPTPDSPNHVTWEVAGAPHSDRWAGDHVRIPSSEARPKLTREEEDARRDRVDNFGQVPDPGAATCAPGPATGNPFPRRFTLASGLVALDEWVRTSDEAPSAPRMERVGPIPDSPSEKLVRDADGNAVGGLRSPLMVVPIATYDGEGCVSAGTMTPFSPERLAELYRSHEDYLEQLLAATDEAVDEGFLLCRDAETILRKASESNVGGPDEHVVGPACA